MLDFAADASRIIAGCLLTPPYSATTGQDAIRGFERGRRRPTRRPPGRTPSGASSVVDAANLTRPWLWPGTGPSLRPRSTMSSVTSKPAPEPHLRDLVRLRRIRDRIDRVRASARGRGVHPRRAHLGGHLSSGARP